MKNWRLFFHLSTLAWLVIGLSSGIRYFYVLFFTQLFLTVIALGMNIWAAFSFSYLQNLSHDKTLHGQPVNLKLDIHNEQVLPYPMMKIRLETPAYRENRQLNFNLPARSQNDFDLILECPYRGRYDVGMTVIDFIDIFGIVRLPFDMRLLPYYRMKQLLVYPQLDKLQNLPLPTIDSKAFSRHRFATEDQNEPFSTIRKYRAGDPRKRIHWKASLRQQELMTMQFEEAAEPHMLLVLDLSRPPWSDEAGLQSEDALCEGAVALIHYLLRQGWFLRVVSIGDERTEMTGSSMADFQRFYNWLAQVPFDGRQSFARSLSQVIHDYSEVRATMVLSTHMDDELFSTLLNNHHASHPVFTLFAAPAQPDSREALFRSQLQQANLPAWFLHYGERLSEQISVRQL